MAMLVQKLFLLFPILSGILLRILEKVVLAFIYVFLFV